MKVYSFPAVAKHDAKILILGSMPGKISLKSNQYYAYSHNAFWQIMFDLFKIEFSVEYQKRVKLLTDNKIALWDSLAYCERKSSADSDIKNESVNDFDSFFKNYHQIRCIIFNGSAAYHYFKKYSHFNDISDYHILPSTSPANARMNYNEKLEKWRIVNKILNKYNE